jgi:hypothetical protein
MVEWKLAVHWVCSFNLWACYVHIFQPLTYSREYTSLLFYRIWYISEFICTYKSLLLFLLSSHFIFFEQIWQFGPARHVMFHKLFRYWYVEKYTCIFELLAFWTFLFLIFKKEDTLNTGYVPVPRCEGGKAATYSPDRWGCY